MNKAAHLKHLTWGKKLVFVFDYISFFIIHLYTASIKLFFHPKYWCSMVMQVIALSYMFKAKEKGIT